MAERLDTKRFSAHDYDVMETRISFEPHEIRDIVDRLKEADRLDIESGDVLDDIRTNIRHLAICTSEPEVYRLTKTKVRDIADTIEEIDSLIDKLENKDD